MPAQLNSETRDRGLPRAVELVLAVAGLVFATPIFTLAALLIRIFSPGPILFRQPRVGRHGRLFLLYKFRTMRVSKTGSELTSDADERITRIGRILRSTKIDELPQLWNVARGEMSLVGPRPEAPAFVCLDDQLWQRVLEVRPGITDPMTLSLRNEQTLLGSVGENFEDFYRRFVLPYKLRGYLAYDRVRDWKSDLAVLFKTLIIVMVFLEGNAVSAEQIRETVLAEADSTVRENRAAAERSAAKSKNGRRGSMNPPRIRDRVVATARFLWIKRYLIAVDVSLLALAFVLSYLLRFEFSIPRREIPALERQVLYVVILQAATMFGLGVYRFIWRYIGLRETRVFVLAVAACSLAMFTLRLLLPGAYALWRVPFSVMFFDSVLVMVAIIGVRVLRRVVYEWSCLRSGMSGDIDGQRIPVLLIGADSAGRWVANEIRMHDLNDLAVEGFVDDEPQKLHAVIDDIEVLGSVLDLPHLVRDYNIDHVILTIADAPRSSLRRILDICEKIPVRVRIVPNLSEIIRGQLKFTRFRDVQIEDLLGREPVHIEQTSVKQFLQGKTVLVTGAGGSIGSELSRQIAHLKPGNLLLVERAEFALFQIGAELRRSFPGLTITPLVADVGSRDRMGQIIGSYRPHVILHAAAHKHVPMMEENVAEAVGNNVLATHNLCDLAGSSCVECFVLISSDKAVKPTSVMGATKRIAELLVQHMHQRYATRYMAVRFGNVIGSTGSVIPVFQEQIRRGGPVTVTHPEMTRYFMTIPEAAQLVLEAAAMGRGGEIFVLDMGEPVRIVDLAKQLIVLTGLKPFKDIEVVFTGPRPGEKLFEELRLSEENMAKTRHPKIYIGNIARYSNGEILKGIEHLAELCGEGNEKKIREALVQVVPEAQLEMVDNVIEPPLPLKHKAVSG